MSYARRGVGDFTIPGGGTQPGCDPLDAACIDSLLRAQSAGSAECRLHPDHCYGNPGYEAYAQAQNADYLARIAASAKIPTGPNPYASVVWSQKDSDGAWHHYGANNQELFITLPDGSTQGKAATSPSGSGIQKTATETPAAIANITSGIPIWAFAAAGLGVLFLAGKH